MDLTHLMDLVNAKINDDARRGGVMTLGSLRDRLGLLSPETPVVIDGGGYLGELDSYRGYYERLAFAPASKPTTAADIMAALNAADGRTFTGYKGGHYHMDAYTFMHVADYGNCGPFISGLRIEADHAVIETEEEVW